MSNNDLVVPPALLEKIKALDDIEKDIITCLQSAGQAFNELSKEKTSQKQVENHTNNFLKVLGNVETKLTDQINYLIQGSTGQPHEGSVYGTERVRKMLLQRLEHAERRVTELERIRSKHLYERVTNKKPRKME
ncbi:mediator of RNA polymerase II transcription subunit 11-like [Planococcus citri]|uniref:mediator of RNA polymerase II transcription subunit 11-like n=1 Tax=Planococcus citri TaxID=170843 RepID=UPI0031F83027